jgi:hypothetical protein
VGRWISNRQGATAGSPPGTGVSLASVEAVTVIAAPDDVHGDHARTLFVRHDSHIGCPACGAEDRSRGIEVLGRSAHGAPEAHTLAKGLTGDPHDDRPPAVPVLYARLVQARTEAARSDQLPPVGGEPLRKGGHGYKPSPYRRPGCCGSLGGVLLSSVYRVMSARLTAASRLSS